MKSGLWSLLTLCLSGIAQALSTVGPRLLVVTDDVSGKDKYSKFWGDLQSRGFQISYETPKSDPTLFSLGERNYDHLIILPSKVKSLGNSLGAKQLLDFVEAKGNILVALSSEVPTATSLSSFLLELDIAIPPERDTAVIDHFHYDSSAAATHDVLVLPQPRFRRDDVKNYFAGSGVLAVPHAVGFTLGNGNALLAPILKAPATAYTWSKKEEPDASEAPFATGDQIVLAAALQARNSARVAVLGAAELLQDKWFGAGVKGPAKGEKSTKAANQAFAQTLSAWAFQEIGVLKVGKLQHYLTADNNPNWNDDAALSNTELNPQIYRIKNEAAYSIELSEYDMTKWVPFSPPASDAVQLEFSMLSPFHRLSLPVVGSSANSTTFGTSFVLPDQHGIFNFRVNYKRPFLTNVDEKRTVTVRHFAHDEWPRSYVISGAYVYIISIACTVIGFLLFVVFWLFSAPSKRSKAAMKKAQ